MATIRVERADGKVVDEIEWKAEELRIAERPNGPAAAAFLAGGVGVLALGLLTTLSEASTDVADFLNFWNRVGPLTGKTVFASGAFAVCWLALAPLMWRRNVPLNTVFIVTSALIIAGLIGTFPEFFQLLAPD
jgi:uncharacterized membrane protein YdcZ (DUF606 family)